MKKENYIFGKHPVLDLLKREPSRIKKLFVKDGSEILEDRNFLRDTSRAKIRITTADNSFFNRMIKDGNHQGIVAICEEKKLLSLAEYFALVEGKEDAKVVLLDEIQDTHNFGAIIRNCAAFGADVIVADRRQAPVDGNVYKTSAGTVDIVNIVSVPNINEAIRKLKEEKFWVYGLDGGSKEVLDGKDMKGERSAIVVGGESSGIRSETKKLCDKLISIPMEKDVESLNASVSVAIALYEIRR